MFSIHYLTLLCALHNTFDSILVKLCVVALSPQDGTDERRPFFLSSQEHFTNLALVRDQFELHQIKLSLSVGGSISDNLAFLFGCCLSLNFSFIGDRYLFKAYEGCNILNRELQFNLSFVAFYSKLFLSYLRCILLKLLARTFQMTREIFLFCCRNFRNLIGLIYCVVE